MNISENEKDWLVYFDGAPCGPVSAVEIKKGLGDNKLNADDGVIKKGGSDWKKIKNIPLFFYDAKKHPGTNNPLPDLPVPSIEEFNSVITPLIGTTDLKKADNWSRRRLAIVGGSWVLLGAVGGIAAAVLTSKNNTKRQKEDSRVAEFIDKKNL
jgi:hypothetical protein